MKQSRSILDFNYILIAHRLNYIAHFFLCHERGKENECMITKSTLFAKMVIVIAISLNYFYWRNVRRISE